MPEKCEILYPYEKQLKNSADKKFNDPSIIKNTDHVNFNGKNLNLIRFFKVNSLPTPKEHLTPKIYVDQTLPDGVDMSPILSLGPDEELKLDEQDSIVPNSTLTSPKTVIEISTKSYVDRLHEINRNRRDLSSVFNDQGNKPDKNKLASLDSVTIIRNPSSDNEVSNKKYVDDSIGECTLLRFNQT